MNNVLHKALLTIIVLCCIFSPQLVHEYQNTSVYLREIIAILWAIQQLEGVFCSYTCSQCIHTVLFFFLNLLVICMFPKEPFNYAAEIPNIAIVVLFFLGLRCYFLWRVTVSLVFCFYFTASAFSAINICTWYAYKFQHFYSTTMDIVFFVCLFVFSTCTTI